MASAVEEASLKTDSKEFIPSNLIVETASSSASENGSYKESSEQAVELCSTQILEKLVPTNCANNFGHITVTDSENVHLGNKTYINGPVTIKQFVSASPEVDIRSLGIDNKGFTSSEKTISSSRTINPVANGVTQKEKLCKNSLKTLLVKPVYLASIIIGLFILIAITLCILFLAKPESLSGNEDTPCGSQNAWCWWCGGAIFFFSSFIAYFGGLLSKKIPEERSITRKIGDVVTIPSPDVRFVSRIEWVAQPPSGPLDKLKTPVPYVIIAHTATESCTNQGSCVLTVRYIQTFHIDSRKWYDIGYNFLVGGDGVVYIGRDWDYVGAHTKYFNTKSIGIAFIGTFIDVLPTPRAISAAQKLIQLGIKLGKINTDYKLVGHCQLIPTQSPGDMLYKEMQRWPHWVNVTFEY